MITEISEARKRKLWKRCEKKNQTSWRMCSVVLHCFRKNVYHCHVCVPVGKFSTLPHYCK